MQASWYTGGTRLVRVMQVAIVCVAAFDIFTYKPDVEIEYVVDGPNGRWQIDHELSCLIEPASLNSLYPGVSQFDDLFRFAGDIPIRARFCFKARRSDQGQMLIPVREDESGVWFGFPRDSEEALKYASKAASAFVPSPQLEQKTLTAAKEESRRLWQKRILDTLGGTAALVLGLEAVWRLLAWVIKGFVGSPRRTTGPA